MNFSEAEIDKLGQDYTEIRPTYETLIEEAVFILTTAISKAQLKVHSIEGRLKSVESVVAKLNRKNLSASLEHIDDIAGVRVVGLFRSDLDLLKQIISSEFDVIHIDDKINSQTDSFGYMSIHYICKMKGEYEGPRYNAIKGYLFELQVRTICMHAWAVISHYLDYKQELDVPDQLKKSLNALSGLFYVADSSFQQFAMESKFSREVAATQAAQASRKDKSDEPLPINLDTVGAYLHEKFPERLQYPATEASSFVSELNAAGITDLDKLDELISAAADVFADYEKNYESTSSDGKYAALGVARLSLGLADTTYRHLKYGDDEAINAYAARFRAARRKAGPKKGAK